MRKILLSAVVLGLFQSTLALAADPIVRVFGRLTNPNHCQYYSVIDGDFYIRTQVSPNSSELGHIEARIAFKRAYSPENPSSWILNETPVIFDSITDRDFSTLYQAKISQIVASRGAQGYDSLRFKMQTEKGTLPAQTNTYYVVKFGDVLPVGCNPEKDSYSELKVVETCIAETSEDCL